MVVKRPGRADDYVAALHRVGFVFAYEDRFLGRLADQARFAAQIAVRLGALAGHENLRVHPDRKLRASMPTTERMPVMPFGPDGDDLARSASGPINAVPCPVRRGVALARRRASLASQPGADEMVLGEKTFEIFVGRSDVNQVNLQCRSDRFFTTKIAKDTKVTRRKNLQ